MHYAMVLSCFPGVVSIPKNLKKNDLVGIYTQKGEIVGLGNSY